MVISFPAVGEVYRFTDKNGAALSGVIAFPTQGEGNNAFTPQIHVMDQVNRQFKPNLLLISAGDNVSFPNSDSIRHHVYSFSSVRSFDIELYGNSETPTLDFPNSGLVIVGCNIHDDMIGFIVVSANGEFYQSNNLGELELPAEIRKDEWYVWHPWMAAAGYPPVLLTELSASEPHQFNVQAPEERVQSDLESRFRRRLHRGH